MKKQGSKPKTQRLKKEYSAGGVVYKKVKSQRSKVRIKWLLIQPTGGNGFHDKIRWQLPKGWVEKGEEAKEAALREVKEEGGVRAKIIDRVDAIKIFFRNVYENKPEELVYKTITFYLMEYLEDTEKGPCWETKARIWLPYQKAYARLTFDSEKKILKKAKKILEEKERQLGLL